jgi:hypothetical protein
MLGASVDGVGVSTEGAGGVTSSGFDRMMVICSSVVDEGP